MSLLHDAMMEILRPQVDAGSASFEVHGEERDVWNCFFAVIFYCCDISEGKNVMFEVRSCFDKTLCRMVGDYRRYPHLRESDNL